MLKFLFAIFLLSDSPFLVPFAQAEISVQADSLDFDEIFIWWDEWVTQITPAVEVFSSLRARTRTIARTHTQPRAHSRMMNQTAPTTKSGEQIFLLSFCNKIAHPPQNAT